MVFDRLLYIDRLKQAGIDETIARAHADALHQTLIGAVATEADLNATKAELQQAIGAPGRKMELLARDLTIRGVAGLIAIASLLVGLKTFG